MFTPVAARYDGPELEQGVLDFWRSERIFERIIERGGDRELFVFYEGPPTANGRPGIHHVLARTSGDAEALVFALRRELLALEPSLVFMSSSTLEKSLETSLLPERVGAMLAAGFGGLGTLLASIDGNDATHC